MDAACQVIQTSWENINCDDYDTDGIKNLMTAAIGELPCDLTLCGVQLGSGKQIYEIVAGSIIGYNTFFQSPYLICLKLLKFPGAEMMSITMFLLIGLIAVQVAFRQ